MMSFKLYGILFLVVALGGTVTHVATAEPAAPAVDQSTRDALLGVIKKRQLTPGDIMAAASTYTPPGVRDEYLCLNSGGQAGSVIAYGVPSMRIFKYIATGAPDSATGFGYDEESRAVRRQGNIEGQELTWADTHHPALSETNGKYDGRYLFINDKSNPRIFVIDLRDFSTKQIVTNPLYRASHGGAFTTPNTEYIIESAQYPAPLDRSYHPLAQGTFDKFFRGGITYHKFDKELGRIIPERSFTVEAPPYTQDLSDAGKGESDGWSFTNSFCTERYVPGTKAGHAPYEVGCSAKDTDYMHVVNWKKAEQVAAEGKRTLKINGHTVIPIQVAVDEGILFLIPEAKSPHGVDVSPDGRYILVGGKLDTHGSVYDFRAIKDLIDRKEFAEKDPYGIPILDMKKSLHGQVELGLGPLHTQFDAKPGIAYTSVFIDSMVVKWDYLNLKVLDKVSVHYNIGHLAAMQGDSQDPRGKYLLALNKMSIDRFDAVGPLHPQNHQLIDISGEKMRLLYDLPLPLGEPHYTVCIDSKDVKSMDVYPPGTDAATMKPSLVATVRGAERVVRKGKTVEVFGTVAADGILPLAVEANQGDEVLFHLTNTEQTPDRSQRFTVSGGNALGILPPGDVATVRFAASQAGLFNYQAEALDGAFDGRVYGQILVKPDKAFERLRLAGWQRDQAQHVRLMAPVKFAQTDATMAPGQAEFETYGCGGCHVLGREAGGPDLADVTMRRAADWMEGWITHPEQHYDDPTIVPLIARFAVKMPNQGVPAEDARKIITYLASWKSQPVASAPGAAPAGPGAAVFAKICFACHANGVGGAPKAGSKEAWGPRIAQGKATLYQHALGGFQGKAGFMPPKGACVDCTDEQIKAGVDYLVSRAEAGQ